MSMKKVFNNYLVRVEEFGHEWEMVNYEVIVTDELPNGLMELESLCDDTGEVMVVEDYMTRGLAYNAMFKLIGEM